MPLEPKVLLDFDGTVTVEDSVDAILDAFACPAWRDYETDWERGRIGSRECMARQAELIRATPAQLARCVDALPIDDAVRDVVATCAAHDANIEIVSDGYDFVIERVLSRLRVSCAVSAGCLARASDERWRFASPHAHADCATHAATCKCAHARGARIVLIGDGRSDFCVAEQAEFVFAKAHLAAYCRARRIPHQQIGALRDVVAPLGEVLRAWRRERAVLSV